MKSTPAHTKQGQIEIIKVEGRRNEHGINEKEAERVISKLHELIKEYEIDNIKTSIGIISPFASQAKYINRLLRDELEVEVIKQFDLYCGTPYNFQGSEREVILLSFCVSPDSHPSAFAHLNKPEVMNVGITRAKSFQYIFTSVEKKDIKSSSLLYRYLRFAEGYTHERLALAEQDRFQQEVKMALGKLGIAEVRCGYPLAGSLLDILVTHNGVNLFIDLIGYPGQFINAFSIERYRTLSRTGIRCMPLHYTLWIDEREKALSEILKRLG